MLSIDNGFIFVHVPKTGGNSIQNVLLDHSENTKKPNIHMNSSRDNFSVVNQTYPQLKKHSRLIDYYRVLEPDVFESLYKFSVLRNPWDWCVSWYFHRNLREWDKDLFYQFIRKTPTYIDFFSINSSGTEFFNKVFRKTGTGIRVGDTALSQNLDYVIRFEDLSGGFSHVCNALGLENEGLPHVNKSEHGTYREYYDPKSRALVEKKFFREIEYGEYTFE